MRLHDAVQKAKVELQHSSYVDINIPYITRSEDYSYRHLFVRLTNKQFEFITNDLIQFGIEFCGQSLSDSNLTKEEIDHWILIGDNAKFPSVRNHFQSYFGKAPIYKGDMEYWDAMGAAIHGAIISDEYKHLVLLDMLSCTLGIKLKGGSMCKIITRETIPCKKIEYFTTSYKEILY